MLASAFLDDIQNAPVTSLKHHFPSPFVLFWEGYLLVLHLALRRLVRKESLLATGKLMYTDDFI